MEPPGPLKRVPKWALLVAGGVGIGGIALKFINKRDADVAAESGTTGTDPNTGQAIGTAPPGVIVPPVIMGGSGDDGAGSAALSELAGVLGAGFTDVLDTAKGLAWTPGEITGLISQNNWSMTDNLIALMGAAGPPPAPAAQAPTIINVLPPAPAPTPAQGPAVASCPSGFPKRSSKGCYKECQHNDKDSNGKKYCNQGHCYSDGTRVHVQNTPGSC